MSTLHRTRKKEKEYGRYLKNHADTESVCIFCDLTENSIQVIKQYELFRVITNTFPYTIWDSCKVTEHMMIVPLRHVESMSQFTKEEIVEYHDLASQYENSGYDVYTRGATSGTKSVPHQHTHLIKTNGKKIKGLLYVQRPLIHQVIS